MGNFEKDNYIVIKKFISEELAFFLFSYLFMKRNVYGTLIKEKIIPPFVHYFGTYSDKQVPNTYSHYCDIAMDNLLFLTKEKVEKIMNVKLIETYSYCRIYKKGDVLRRHKDRPSCQLSATVNLGGDSWPIYLEPSGEIGKKGVQVDLKPGDALFYKGCKVEHWREPFEGEHCGQVFLHYNSDNNIENLYDNRPHLGLPAECKRPTNNRN